MIGPTSRQVYANGVETSAVIVSTSLARDSTVAPGASQATILVSGRAPAPELTAFWLVQLGISPTGAIPPAHPGAIAAYRDHDSVSRLRKEAVVLAPDDRTIVAFYVGLDGTFEANRPHLIDLLRTLRVQVGQGI